ncbi:hypothetical protein D9619_009127 [Psilocybe cf. subviscida]|uniref:21S rRNA pseudouridine(2819) synthase n=1 Tax=Psilocybe cf. subviscida TaxID=2480587 RepID=A0A8H5FAP9_9AGAR|nr:hypothetical protein D9619_009127 [Psilocybe cf. subviscida]
MLTICDYPEIGDTAYESRRLGDGRMKNVDVAERAVFSSHHHLRAPTINISIFNGSTRSNSTIMASAQYVGRLTQRMIYDQLRAEGSPWLKKHVLYADRQVIVMNKPPGLICQLDHKESTAKPGPTSLNSVFKDIRSCFPTAHPYPVHRLDRMTTGCLAIPVQYSAAKSLSLQFQKGTVHKSYLALVRGGEKTFSETKGTIRASLLYDDGRPEIDPMGKESITEWEVLASSPKVPISLLRLNLITGNKHQLRIHLAKVLKAPILGDNLYSQSPLHQSVLSRTHVPEDGLFLHGSDLSFFKYRPNGNRYRLGIHAPVPLDFMRICKDLGVPLPASYKQPGLSIDGEPVHQSVGHAHPNDESEWDLRLWNPALPIVDASI